MYKALVKFQIEEARALLDKLAPLTQALSGEFEKLLFESDEPLSLDLPVGQALHNAEEMFERVMDARAAAIALEVNFEILEKAK